ncbi:MAG: hypothetical protein JNK04_06150, partial [Myxococcales bacterium]|nr:hypothetical protein [Myxococcales bacterium]
RNLDAFEAYGKGLAFLNAKRVPDALREFARAVALDPTYSSGRAAMMEARARSNHMLVKPDGSVISTVLFVVPASSDATTWPLSTNMGKVLNAWDLQGKPLKIAAEAQPNEHMKYTFTLPPVTPGRERRIVYEYQRPKKIRQKDGLFAYSSGYSTSEGGEQTTIIELPAGSEVLSVSPIPAQLSVDPSATFVMINERRSPFDSYFMTLLFTADSAAKKAYLDKTPSERLDRLRALDILPENQAVGERLASMVEPAAVCLHAARGRKAEAEAALASLEKQAADKLMLEANASFLLHRARACVAKVNGDGRRFVSELSAALAEKSRPSELVQDALYELVDAQLESKQPARALEAVKTELARAGVVEAGFFSTPPPLDEKNPAVIVELANAAITSGDFDGAGKLLDKIDKKAVTLYWHLAKARLAVARYEKSPSDEAAGDVRAELLPIIAAHPMPWLFADTAFMWAHAGRAAEALDLLLKKAPDHEAAPPLYDALRAVIANLPEPEARLGSLLTLLRAAGETEYGSHYRLEMVAGAIGATAKLPEGKREGVARGLFAEAEKLLAHTGDATCDRACQKASLAGACPALAALEPKQREIVTRAGACEKR